MHEYTPVLNYGNVNHWLSACKRSHKVCKEINTNSLDHGDFKVIDCDAMNLVYKEASKIYYFALSYRWGNKTALLQATMTNVKRLEQPEALKDLDGKLANTIRDAIEFTQDLGWRYLWVDQLCIIQDGAEKESLLSSIDQIYMDAHVVIIAAVGSDASAGLPGIKSRPRKDFADREEGNVTLLETRTLKQLLEASDYETKGWT